MVSNFQNFSKILLISQKPVAYGSNLSRRSSATRRAEHKITSTQSEDKTTSNQSKHKTTSTRNVLRSGSLAVIPRCSRNSAHSTNAAATVNIPFYFQLNAPFLPFIYSPSTIVGRPFHHTVPFGRALGPSSSPQIHCCERSDSRVPRILTGHWCDVIPLWGQSGHPRGFWPFCEPQGPPRAGSRGEQALGW